MAGIYIHIPFCRQKCHYCNFFSSASQKLKTPFLQALRKELEQNRDYLSGQTVTTIYFGGGTPSLLSTAEIEGILGTICSTFPVSAEPEITLEVNPDNLTDEYLNALSQTRINRLSIGVQSFFDKDLLALNRIHTTSQAVQILDKMQDTGYRISIDLIYGIPEMTDERWIQNLETAIGYGIPHISAYALTVEERTPLHWMIGKGKYPAVSEEQAARQYSIMIKLLKDAGYEHYEVSNFCKPGFESKHNSNYWKGIPYLGAGPSAHSYNGTSRRWNVSNISEYVNKISDGELAYEEETLTLTDRYNEYIMTGLRTMWGCDAGYILKEFGSVYFDHFSRCVENYTGRRRHEDMKTWRHEGNVFRLTDEGLLSADGIAADFFLPQ